ncbi:MAG TPA: hypothetical protein VJM78_00175 [Rhizomicrobium sp.]|nr:hypothetical protein [Rhizomicrobium sp.]
MEIEKSRLRKITVRVPKAFLEGAQAHTGECISRTVTAALDQLISDHAQQKALMPRKGRD